MKILFRTGLLVALSIVTVALLWLSSVGGAASAQVDPADAATPTATSIPRSQVINKTGSPNPVAPGGILDFVVTIRLDTAQNNVQIEDIMSNGVDLRPGSTPILDGSTPVTVTLVARQTNRITYRFGLGNLPAGTHTLTYQGVVSPDANCSLPAKNEVHLILQGVPGTAAMFTMENDVICVTPTATGSATATATPTATSTATPAATGTPTATATPTATVTGTPPTETATATATATGTPGTETPTATATVTGTPATETPTSTPVPTSPPSGEEGGEGERPSATSTPVPTATPIPTGTPEVAGAAAGAPATGTPVPATATPETPAPTETPQVAAAAPPVPSPEEAAVRALPAAGEGGGRETTVLLALAGLVAVISGHLLKRWAH